MATIPALPAINTDACSGWTPQQLNLYAALPAWFVEREVAYRKKYGNFKRIFGSMDWVPNKGPTITGIITEPPPTLSQFNFPALMSVSCAKKDIVQARQREFTVQLAHQKFESPVFQWLQSFNDFVTKMVTKHLDFVFRWQEERIAQYYRGFVFHQAPAIMWCDDASLVIDDLCPIGVGNNDGTAGKSNAYLQSRVATLGAPGNLTLKSLFFGLNYLEEDALAVPYQSGSAKDDSYLNDKFLLLTSSEAYNNFINDPFLKENRQLNLDIVTEGFKGSLFGRVTTALHSNPLRFDVAADGSVSWPAPETIQENQQAPNFGQTVRSCAYRNAQFEVAFLCGMNGYDIINVGPPPAEFAAGGADRLGRLRWNGRPYLTDRINVPCEDSEGNPGTPDPNSYNEFLKIQSYCAMGIAPVTTRNVMPIVFRRARTITTSIV